MSLRRPLPRLSYRTKLLLLTLAPLLLVLPLAMALILYWGQAFSYEQLYRKVRADLRVADQAFQQLEHRHLARLGSLADSEAFRRKLASQDGEAMDKLLRRFRQRNGLAFLHVTDREGRRRQPAGPGAGASPATPLHQRALTGQGASGLEVFDREAVRRAGEGLVKRVSRSAMPVERALVMRLVQPIERQGRVVALLDGAILINGNLGLADSLRQRVYGADQLPQGSRGTVSLLLGDRRIASGPADGERQAVLGTRAAEGTRQQGLGGGSTRVGRTRLGEAWYLAGYRPLQSTSGERVAMLQAGFREAPFRNRIYTAFGAFLALLGLSGVVAVALAVAGVNRLFRPLRHVTEVVRAVRAGGDRRIGPLAGQDEVGELGREFDAMLDRLQDSHRQLREAAEQMEGKVEERTQELSRRNRELQETVTQLQQTRRQLVEAEKRVALGQLTAGVAHEINNPTAVILNNLELVIEELGPDLDPVRGEIDLILEQVERIQRIVGTLSQYAGPGGSGARGEMVDLGEVVNSTYLLVNKALEKTGARLATDLGPRGPVWANHQELQQVLVNLIVNAAQASGPGGTVRLLSRPWGDVGVRLGVSDDGVGIPPDRQSRLFDPFYTTKADGSGLGLAVSYGIIRHYGGDITVDSVPGEGATFWLWLRFEAEDGRAGGADISRAPLKSPPDAPPPGSSPGSPPR